MNDNKYKVYVAATPIGNIKDVSINFLDTLNCVDTIFCEDTRVTQKLLNNLEIKNKYNLVSFYKYNEEKKLELINKYIQQSNILLVSDAGYPSISDPGFSFIQHCIKNNIKIEIINGPSALIHALVKSGFRNDTFMFLGFLNPKQQKQINYFESIKNIDTTFVIYESVHRIIETLNNISVVFKDVNVCVCKELTKMYETFFYGNAQQIINQLNGDNLKGEFVVIIDNKLSDHLNTNNFIDKAKELIKLDLNNKTILNILLIDYPNQKNEIYDWLIKNNK